MGLADDVSVRTCRFFPLLIGPLVLTALAGCSPSAPTEPEPAKFTTSLNEVHDASKDVVEETIAEFPGATVVADADPQVDACMGEDPGVGHWIWATTFSSTDLANTVTRLQQERRDAVTSTGTKNETVEYADGTTWPTTGAHTLFEDETGSYLLTYQPEAGGTALLRVITACGVLR